MLYSYQWLKELSGTTRSATELTELFTVHSFEVEHIDDLSRGLEKVVIGEVLTKSPHPNADRLHVTTVAVGAEKPLTIVCGAPNVAVGQKVPVALVGAHLPSGLTIKKSVIRGQASEGMICAEDELSIGKNHDGIIVLPDDAPVGASFAAYAGRDDTVIDMKILPNRGHDCLSHIGVANEIRALEGKKGTPRDGTLPRASALFDARVTTDRCRRYSVVALDNLTLAATPAWMVNRLRACGVHSVNVIVDVTNYVMLETGQPLHAFDGARAARIVVRMAKPKETLTLLDNVTHALTPDDIVITDGTSPIALAGVMGGAHSAITSTTATVVLESASFDASTIRRMRRRHNVLTDAAFRFERDIDPSLTVPAIARATALLRDLCGARVRAAVDIDPAPVTPWTITVKRHAVRALLGLTIDDAVIVDILTRLGMDVTTTDDAFTVCVPTVRRDLTTPEDIIEEIGRMHGYANITPAPLRAAVAAPAPNALRRYEHTVTDVCVASGFDEMKSYSYYAPDDARAIGIDQARHISVLNPLTPEFALMRRSMIPGLCAAAAKNLRYASETRLCDIGRIYAPTDKALPDEVLTLGAAVAARGTAGEQFYALKGLAENIAAHVDGGFLYDDTWPDHEAPLPRLHSARRAVIRTRDGAMAGWIGEVPARTQKHYGIKNVRVAVMELSIATLLAHSTETTQKYAPLPKYPTVERDLSMLVPPRLHVADLLAVVTKSAGPLLRNASVFDTYHNAATNERSVAFRMTFAAPDRTLTADEVDAAVAAVITRVEKNGDITVRQAK